MPQSQSRLAPSQIVFAPAQKTVTFDVPGFALESVVMITNAASGRVIYDPEDESGALGGTVSGSVLTLAYDTTGMAASDQLRVIYNDLSREDLLLKFSPTATGFFARIPVASYQQAILQMPASGDTQVQIWGSLDGDQTRAVQIRGILPDLGNNQGDVNNTSGGSYNLRYHEIAQYRFIHLNCSNYSSGTPQVLLALKTSTPPHHLGYIIGGSIGVSLNGSTSQIGYIATGMNFSELFAGTIAANALITGAARDCVFSPIPYNRFGAVAVTDQAATLSIQLSTNGTKWITVASQAVSAGVPLDISVPIRARFYRALLQNGSTATGTGAATLLTSFLGA